MLKYKKAEKTLAPEKKRFFLLLFRFPQNVIFYLSISFHSTHIVIQCDELSD